MRKRPLLAIIVLAATSIAAAPVSTTSSSDAGDPWPLGVCVHVPSVHAKPLCVLVDPTE